MIPPDPGLKPFLSVTDAGRCLGLSRSAAYRAVERGTLPAPAMGPGGRLRVATWTVWGLLGLDPTMDVGPDMSPVPEQEPVEIEPPPPPLPRPPRVVTAREPLA